MSSISSCPSCSQHIELNAVKCPKCHKQLKILCWEIERTNGEVVVFSGEQAVQFIKEGLLDQSIRLSDRCRLYFRALKAVIDGKEEFEIKGESKWKSLKEYANKNYDLQVLYNPVIAQMNHTMKTASSIFAFLTSLCLILYALVLFWQRGLNIPSLVFLAAQIVGFVIGGSAIGMFLGAIVGMPIGVIIGLRKKKMIRG